MKQNVITIVIPLEETTVDAERARLAIINQRVIHEDLGYDLSLANTLHFMSCSAADLDDVPTRIIEFNIDGDEHAFIRSICDTHHDYIADILDKPANTPAGELRRILNKHTIFTNIYHIGNTGRTRDRILSEAKILQSASDRKTQLQAGVSNRWQLWGNVCNALTNNENVLIFRTPRKPFWVRNNLFAADFWAKVGGWLPIITQVLLFFTGIHAVTYLDKQVLLGFAGFSLLIAVFRLIVSLRWMPKRLRLRPYLKLFLRFCFSASLTGVLWTIYLSAILGIYDNWTTFAGIVEVVVLFLLLLTSFVIAMGVFLSIQSIRTFLLLALNILSTSWVVFGIWPLPFSPPDAFQALSLTTIAGGQLLLTLLLILLFTGAAMLRLRALEETDSVDEHDVQPDQLPSVVARNENMQTQNHLISITTIKEGAFRLKILKRVLRTVNFLARVMFNRGTLGGAGMIHFARFVIIKDRHLLFIGNYDGNWGSYLGDFKEIIGLTAVWSNTGGFPRSFYLLFEGGIFERQFKRYARNSHIPSSLWYSAYPNLSVQAIDRATETCHDFNRPMDKPGKGFLKSIWRLIKSPLSEADLELALRRLD